MPTHTPMVATTPTTTARGRLKLSVRLTLLCCTPLSSGLHYWSPPAHRLQHPCPDSRGLQLCHPHSRGLQHCCQDSLGLQLCYPDSPDLHSRPEQGLPQPEDHPRRVSHRQA